MDLNDRDKELIKTLYPPFQAMCFSHLAFCWSLGINAHLTQAMRTWEEQTALMEKGASRAIGGMSYHNYGIAYDIAFDNDSGRDGLQDPYQEPKVRSWETCANLGARCGLKAGHFWTSFQDKPHYQANIKTGIAYLREAFVRGGMVAVWDYLDTLEKDAFKLPLTAFKIDQ